MPDAVAAIAPILQIGTSGAGIVGNILNSIQQGKVASAAAKNANLSPTQLATQVSQAEQPLDRSLINTVNNQVQADMASRGLAEAPGIFASTEAQALAPFQQQNQQAALQLIMQKLGLPAETLYALRAGGGGYANLSPLLQSLLKLFPAQAQPNNFSYWAANNANPRVPPGIIPDTSTPPDISGDSTFDPSVIMNIISGSGGAGGSTGLT